MNTRKIIDIIINIPNEYEYVIDIDYNYDYVIDIEDNDFDYCGYREIRL